MNITELRFLIFTALEFHFAALSLQMRLPPYHPGWLLELELSTCNPEERTTYPPQTLTCGHTSKSCSHHFHVCPSAQSLVTKPQLTGKCSLYSRQSCAQLKAGVAFSKKQGEADTARLPVLVVFVFVTLDKTLTFSRSASPNSKDQARVSSQSDFYF